MTNDPLINKAVIQATLLGWPESYIIDLIYKEYKCNISLDIIRHIKEDSGHQIDNFRKQLIVGKYSIHKRIIKFAKKNSLNLNFISQQNNLNDLIIISRIIYIINKFNKISFIQVNNLYKEYFGQSKIDINTILEKIEIPEYNKTDNIFLRTSSTNSNLTEIKEIEHCSLVYKIINNNRIFVDSSKNELHIFDQNTPLRFMITALTLSEIKSDPKISEFINEIIGRS